MEKPHILIVEDEQALGILLKENLKAKGFTTKLCKDGLEGWNTFKTERFDLCILDVNMPKMNGYELAKNIREKSDVVPIIFLTANSAQDDKIKGFDYGADEYITKPFNLDELVARIRAILKRTQYAAQPVAAEDENFEIGQIVLDFTNHNIKVKGEDKRISTTEALLLKIFINNKNNLLTRNAILLNVWGRDDYYTARNLDVYINKLRKLIKEDNTIEIVNIHGSGFKLAEISPT
ncbi:MAG: response regulator transcription factor [Bacteroidia bacterium]|nr:response regulator transcription factor [Bacteroidia bacterium]